MLSYVPLPITGESRVRLCRIRLRPLPVAAPMNELRAVVVAHRVENHVRRGVRAMGVRGALNDGTTIAPMEYPLTALRALLPLARHRGHRVPGNPRTCTD